MDEKKNINNKDENKKSTSKYSFVYYLFYIIVIFTSIFLMQQNFNKHIALGDFGSVTTVLFFMLAITSLRWLPILSVFGIVIYYFRNKLKDIYFVYFVFILVVFATSIIVLFFT